MAVVLPSSATATCGNRLFLCPAGKQGCSKDIHNLALRCSHTANVLCQVALKADRVVLVVLRLAETETDPQLLVLREVYTP